MNTFKFSNYHHFETTTNTPRVCDVWSGYNLIINSWWIYFRFQMNWIGYINVQCVFWTFEPRRDIYRECNTNIMNVWRIILFPESVYSVFAIDISGDTKSSVVLINYFVTPKSNCQSAPFRALWRRRDKGVLCRTHWRHTVILIIMRIG